MCIVSQERQKYNLATPLDSTLDILQERGYRFADAPLKINNMLLSSELTLENIETVFCFCGEFVEHITFAYFPGCTVVDANFWRSSVKIIECIPNLEKLSFVCFEFSQTQILELQDLIEARQFEELIFWHCEGFLQKWRAARVPSKVVKVTFATFYNFHETDNRNSVIIDNFCNFFRNLSSLTIFMDHFWRMDNLVQIFDGYSHCLQHLKLTEMTFTEGSESVGTLVTDKLQKLESLELEFVLNNQTKYMIELPHLKSLTMYDDDDWNQSINSYLRKLSVNGIIEELFFFTGVFVNPDANEPALQFKNLRKIGWNASKWPGFLKTLIRSQMPVIQSVTCFDIQITELEELLNFVKSKNTLKLIQLLVVKLNQFGRHEIRTNIPSNFWIQLIDLLKEPSSPRRPLLTVAFYNLILGEEEV